MIERGTTALSQIDGRTHAVDIGREATEQRLLGAFQESRGGAYGIRERDNASRHARLRGERRTCEVERRAATAVIGNGESEIGLRDEREIVTQQRAVWTYGSVRRWLRCACHRWLSVTHRQRRSPFK